MTTHTHTYSEELCPGQLAMAPVHSEAGGWEVFCRLGCVSLTELVDLETALEIVYTHHAVCQECAALKQKPNRAQRRAR